MVINHSNPYIFTQSQRKRINCFTSNDSDNNSNTHLVLFLNLKAPAKNQEEKCDPVSFSTENFVQSSFHSSMIAVSSFHTKSAQRARTYHAYARIDVERTVKHAVIGLCGWCVSLLCWLQLLSKSSHFINDDDLFMYKAHMINAEAICMLVCCFWVILVRIVRFDQDDLLVCATCYSLTQATHIIHIHWAKLVIDSNRFVMWFSGCSTHFSLVDAKQLTRWSRKRCSCVAVEACLCCCLPCWVRMIPMPQNCFCSPKTMFKQWEFIW